MKTKILTFFLTFAIGGVFHTILAQETARQRLQRQNRTQTESNENPSIGLTARAAQMNRYQTDNMENARWLREIYRYLDLDNDKNASLYYPVQPEDGRMNLFTMIFKLLSEGKINAYEYVDGRESFTDEFKIDFKEFLDRFGIYYEQPNGQITVADVDIPSPEVMGYYVKEAYYFETGTSNYGVKTLAVCPVLIRQGDYDANTTRYPLFWIPYDEIRPYAMRMPVMTSSLNNVMSGTVDDFFRKHDYDGEIYKTTNLQGKAIAQYANTPEAMKAEQEKIEKQLKDFEDHLWKQEQVRPAPAATKEKRSLFRRQTKNTTSGVSSSVSMRDRRF